VAGSRLLAQRLAAPLTDAAAIARRADAVAALVADPAAREAVRQELKAAPDLARALARLVIGRGGPRDLAAIRDGLAAATGLARILNDGLLARPDAPAEISEAAVVLAAPDPVLEATLGAALADELPLLKRDGGFVREGHDPGLDEARRLRDDT